LKNNNFKKKTTKKDRITANFNKIRAIFSDPSKKQNNKDKNIIYCIKLYYEKNFDFACCRLYKEFKIKTRRPDCEDYECMNIIKSHLRELSLEFNEYLCRKNILSLF